MCWLLSFLWTVASMSCGEDVNRPLSVRGDVRWLTTDPRVLDALPEQVLVVGRCKDTAAGEDAAPEDQDFYVVEEIPP